MTVPAPGAQLKIASLGTDAKLLAGSVKSVTLLGCAEKLVWSQQADGLVITCPKQMPFQTAVCFKIVLSQPIDSLAAKGDGHHQINEEPFSRDRSKIPKTPHAVSSMTANEYWSAMNCINNLKAL
jgi:hypothetical protein